MGDELHVIVARTVSVSHKPDPVLPDAQHRETVAVLEPPEQRVDHA